MISEQEYEWLLNNALKDQADAHRWWWLTTFSTQSDIQYLITLEKSEWNDYVDARLAEFDD